VARLLVDSTVIIDALRGRAAADRLRQARRRGDEPWVCVVSVEEIWRGVFEREHSTARRLFRGLRCAPLGVAEGERAGRWRRGYAARGVTLHQADCLIAAAAVGIGATLVTGSPRDFPMDELEVAHWPAGE
jgi:predicted nucleic acid-binding protein